MRIAAVGSVLALAAVPLAAQAPIVPPAEPVVVTQGHAVINAAPDRAYVTVAAESRSRNSAEAQKANAEAMTQVLQRLQQAGVSKDSIRTLSYELTPEFDYANGRQTFRDYLVRNSVEVRVDDMNRVGAVIDAAATGGATSIGGVRFDLRNRQELERDALKQAVADARARAEAAAAGAGRSIDRIVKIEESVVPEMPRPMLRMAPADAAVATPIAPSNIEIQARVTLTASIR